MIIALHGDLASAEMLRRDVGDLRNSIDLFFDARGWLRFERQCDKLLSVIQMLPEPPILIGYSRGGSVIAKLSNEVAIQAAVLYESPIIDSETVGGSFPVLMIWNDHGAKYGKRSDEALHSEQLWEASHPVNMLEGKGGHMKRRPLGHGWDVSLNAQIRDWLADKTS